MRDLKRHSRVYILSSKHTYRPMRARVVAQLFYKQQLLTCVVVDSNLRVQQLGDQRR